MAAWLDKEPLRNGALATFVGCALAYWLVADTRLWYRPSDAPHYAMLADAWIHGSLSLPDGKPSGVSLNDFARLGTDWYVTFPPIPALALTPFVALLGRPATPDGLLPLLVAPVVPCVLYWVLERYRELGRTPRSPAGNLVLALSFGLGSVYYYSSIQGTVWFAAHVWGTLGVCLFLLGAAGLRAPLLAGCALCIAGGARVPTFLAAAYLLWELAWAPRDKWRPAVIAFFSPLMVFGSLLAAHNYARFGSPLDFGYRHLLTRFHDRMVEWGLFHYRYLGRNLAVVLAGLPFWREPGSIFPFQIGGNGLALWITTPAYLWLIRPLALLSIPKQSPNPFFDQHQPAFTRKLVLALASSALLVALPTLFYQNTGWFQFGYRFSNDYSPFLFLLLAVTLPPLKARSVLGVALLLAVIINLVGAVTFMRPEYQFLYFFRHTGVVQSGD